MDLPFGNKNEQVAAEDKHFSAIKNYLIPFGSVLAPALGLFATSVPIWITVVIMVYLFFVIVYSLHPVWRWLIIKGLARRRMINAIKSNMPAVVKILEKVSPQIERSRSGTVFSIWADAASKEGVKGGIYADSSHFETLNSWGVQILDDLRTARISEGMRIVRSISAWLFQYAQLCDQARRDIDVLIRTGKLEGKDLEEVKQEWNHTRDGHNHVITEWVEVCREINRELRGDVLSTYFPTLKPL